MSKYKALENEFIVLIVINGNKSMKQSVKAKCENQRDNLSQ